MYWVELSVRAEAEAVDAVAELLGAVAHGGIAMEQPVSDADDSGQAGIDPDELVTVKGYLPEGCSSEAAILRVEESVWHLSQLRRIEPLRVTRLAEEDWAEAWKKFFFVQRIGERVVIKPSWREYDASEDEVVVELDPGMAFGTGLHPTTRMCLLACERYVGHGMRVLDLGTGSAILAITAAKLGAGSVLALDVDPVAVEVARKNVAMNRLTDRIEVLRGSLDPMDSVGAHGVRPAGVLGARDLERVQGAAPGGVWGVPNTPLSSPLPPAGGKGPGEGGGFDLVLANIIAGVIAELAGGLRDALAPDGTLVASGIISEREGLVLEAFRSAGLAVLETISEGDWRTLVAKRVGS